MASRDEKLSNNASQVYVVDTMKDYKEDEEDEAPKHEGYILLAYKLTKAGVIMLVWVVMVRQFLCS
jgi:hypothetical protein